MKRSMRGKARAKPFGAGRCESSQPPMMSTKGCQPARQKSAMSDFRHVTDDFSTAPQISIADVAEAAARASTLINNRPDGEADRRRARRWRRRPRPPAFPTATSRARRAGAEVEAVPGGAASEGRCCRSAARARAHRHLVDRPGHWRHCRAATRRSGSPPATTSRACWADEAGPCVREIEFEYSACDQVSPLIRRVVCNNPGPFTFKGTGTYIVGRGEVAVIDPGPDEPPRGSDRPSPARRSATS